MFRAKTKNDNLFVQGCDTLSPFEIVSIVVGPKETAHLEISAWISPLNMFFHVPHCPNCPNLQRQHQLSSSSVQLPSRKCIYDVTALKFLVQTRDDVEAGDEKIKELESEMREIGLFDSEFSLGDVLDEGEDEQSASPNNGPKKKKLEEYPDVEGDESLPEYIGQYKRACLSRKALLKTTKERLEKDNVSPADYKLLGCSGCQLLFKASFHVLPQLVEILNLWCFRSKV